MAGTHDQPTEKRQKRAKRVILLVIGLMLAAGLVCNYWPMEGHITISRETTYITGPLNEDGTVNYLAALNERLSKGVTPENNAVVLLIRAVGPEYLAEPMRRPRQLELLGIEDLPQEGDCLVGIGGFMNGADSASTSQTDDWEAVSNLLDKLAKTPWSAAQHPRVAAWLKANDKPLSVIIDAAKQPRYYVPLVADSEPPCLVDTYVVSILRTDHLFGWPLGVRAMLKLGEGNIARAREDILTIHRLARLFAQDYNLIIRLLGSCLEQMACDAGVALATSGKLTPEQARGYLGDLQKLGPLPDTELMEVESDRLHTLDCVMTLYRGGNLDTLRAKPDLHWDYTLRIINSWYDRREEAYRKPTTRERREALDALCDDLKSIAIDPQRFAALSGLLGVGGRATKPWFSRMTANFLLTRSMPDRRSALSTQQAIAMRLEVVKVSLALAAFRAEKGVYPQKLSELSPAYIKKVPIDIFAEGPLVYKRDGKGYLLYSLGPNMTDDGGVEDEDTGEDDIAVRVK